MRESGGDDGVRVPAAYLAELKAKLEAAQAAVKLTTTARNAVSLGGDRAFARCGLIDALFSQRKRSARKFDPLPGTAQRVVLQRCADGSS